MVRLDARRKGNVMILVVGATGQLGGTIAQMLLDRERPVRILVRPGSAYSDLVAGGAEAVIGDLKDPASLVSACQGVHAVITTANATARGGDDTIESVDRVGNRNLVDAATAAGVDIFVFVSALGASPNHPMELLRAKGETEQHLRDSAMAWTVLQPNMFLDKLPMAVVGGPALAGQPVTLVGEARRVHSMVAMRDRLRRCGARPQRHRRSNGGHRRSPARVVARHRRRVRPRTLQGHPRAHGPAWAASAWHARLCGWSARRAGDLRLAHRQ